jgi:hypothetical protein
MGRLPTVSRLGSYKILCFVQKITLDNGGCRVAQPLGIIHENLPTRFHEDPLIGTALRKRKPDEFVPS